MKSEGRETHREILRKTAQRLFDKNPQLSLKKLAAELKKETGVNNSYSTVGPIYRKLRETM